MGDDEIRAKLLAEIKNMHVDEIRNRRVSLVVEMFEKITPRHNLAAAGGEKFQDGKLPAGNHNRTTAFADAAPGHIDDHVGNGDLRGRMTRRPANALLAIGCCFI